MNRTHAAPKVNPIARGVRAELKPWERVSLMKAIAAAARDRKPAWRERFASTLRRWWKRITDRSAP